MGQTLITALMAQLACATLTADGVVTAISYDGDENQYSP